MNKENIILISGFGIGLLYLLEPDFFNFNKQKAMNKTLFFSNVLRGLGIPQNEYNMNFLLTWAKYENRAKGKPHGYNPLNTTFNLSADKNKTNFNSHKVKNYSTFEHGVNATVKTLKLNYYKNLVNLLRTINSNSITINSTVANEINTWGSHSFVSTFKTA